jgi:predicted acetyltransferase
VTVCEPGAPGDLGALLDLSVRAFGPVGNPEAWQASAAQAVRDGRFLATFDGGRMTAAARYLDLAQCWGGRWLPMAGVSGVTVAPEDRGRGTGRALMTALLGRLATAGYPLSVLYPATSPLYRSLGWELAGGCYTVTVPARSLRTLAAPDPAAAGQAAPAPGEGAGTPAPPVRRCGPADAGQVRTVVGAAHQAVRDSGPSLRDTASIQAWLADPGRFTYLAPDGFLAYRWGGTQEEIRVDRMVAASAATTRALWGIVASHSSVATVVRACLGPADPLPGLLREPDLAQAGRVPWMLRVVDAPAAVAGRGFPAGVTLTAGLALADPACPGHEGNWTLEISGGQGALRPGAAPGGGPALQAGPRGLAGLYAGTPLASLRRAGLVTGGGPATDEALDAAFAAQPFLLETF